MPPPVVDLFRMDRDAAGSAVPGALTSRIMKPRHLTAAFVLAAALGACSGWTPRAAVSATAAAEAAEAAADAWEHAGRLARAALTRDHADALLQGVYIDALDATTAAVRASAAATAASTAALEAAPLLSPALSISMAYEEVHRLLPSDATADAAILFDRGRRDEALALIRDHLRTVERQESAITIAYVRLAAHWRAYAADRP